MAYRDAVMSPGNGDLTDASILQYKIFQDDNNGWKFVRKMPHTLTEDKRFEMGLASEKGV